MGIFEGFRRLLGGNTEPCVAGQGEPAVSHTLKQSASLRPWDDQGLLPEERMESYKALVYGKLEGIRVAFDRAGDAQDVATQKEIMNSPETKKWMDEGRWLQTASTDEFRERMERPQVIRELLGKNFLGAEVWGAERREIDDVPPIPEAITKSLLESKCPLHPGEKIKDTHLLVLVPRTVNGEHYDLLELDDLCARRKGSGESLIDSGLSAWKKQPWAAASQSKSEWVLIPKSDPDPKKVADNKHFRGKTITEQQQVHDTHYKEYREATVMELMTAILLNDIVNKERMLFDDFLRCQEPNDVGGRVIVGRFLHSGLRIQDKHDGTGNNGIGRALARTL